MTRRIVMKRRKPTRLTRLLDEVTIARRAELDELNQLLELLAKKPDAQVAPHLWTDQFIRRLVDVAVYAMDDMGVYATEGDGEDWQREYWPAYATLIRFLLDHPDVNKNHLLPLVENYVSLLNEAATHEYAQNGTDGFDQLDTSMLTELYPIFAATDLTAEKMGFLWRVATTVLNGKPDILSSALLANPNTPTVIACRLLQQFPKPKLHFPSLFPAEDDMTEVWARQAAVEFPELVGLPADLLVNVVASQAVPTVWYAREPDFPTLLAPKGQP